MCTNIVMELISNKGFIPNIHGEPTKRSFDHQKNYIYIWLVHCESSNYLSKNQESRVIGG